MPDGHPVLFRAAGDGGLTRYPAPRPLGGTVGESEARIVGNSWTPPEESEVPDPKAEARRVRLLSELVYLPVDAEPVPAAELRKPLTSAQKRLLKIREVIGTAPRNTPNSELCEYYHRAGLTPPNTWGVASYLQVWGNDRRLKNCFRKEKSAALSLHKKPQL